MGYILCTTSGDKAEVELLVVSCRLVDRALGAGEVCCIRLWYSRCEPCIVDDE
jgi:hypothetical protein